MLYYDYMLSRRAFTLIELLVVIAIIAILAVVAVLTLNPAELLRQSRDANRIQDMATLQSALNLYITDQAGVTSFSLGAASNTYPSFGDRNTTSTLGDQCQGLAMLALVTSTGESWQCAASTTFRQVNGQGWIPVNFQSISSGAPLGSLPVDPVDQTSTGLFYAYTTSGSQFEVTATLESSKYKAQFGQNSQTTLFPEVLSAGTPGLSELYSPSGLVGYWPFEEGSGTTVLDSSGSGDNGTWNGSTTNGSYYTAGKVGNWAGIFGGTSTYVNVPGSAYAFSGPFSISLWMNENSSAVSEVVVSEQTGGAGTGYFINTYPTNTEVQIAITSSTFSYTTGPAPYFGTWEMVTMVYDGTSLSIYINGSLSGSAVSAAPYNPSGALVMGETQRGGFHDFSGSLDDVRIYNRALSPAEIMALYNAEK